MKAFVKYHPLLGLVVTCPKPCCSMKHLYTNTLPEEKITCARCGEELVVDLSGVVQ